MTAAEFETEFLQRYLEENFIDDYSLNFFRGRSDMVFAKYKVYDSATGTYKLIAEATTEEIEYVQRNVQRALDFFSGVE